MSKNFKMVKKKKKAKEGGLGGYSVPPKNHLFVLFKAEKQLLKPKLVNLMTYIESIKL